MEQPRITIAIDGRTYSLRADHTASFSHIPAEDRRHLITLLEAINSQATPLPAATPGAVADTSAIAPAPASSAISQKGHASGRPTTPERAGSGDIDALMARLIMEEKQNRRPGLTKAGIYKVMAGLLLLILLLVMML